MPLLPHSVAISSKHVIDYACTFVGSYSDYNAYRRDLVGKAFFEQIIPFVAVAVEFLNDTVFKWNCFLAE